MGIKINNRLFYGCLLFFSQYKYKIMIKCFENPKFPIDKIKLDKEYNFILPRPLTKAFINAISTTAITYGINSFVVLIENIFITANIITHAITSVVSIVITVCVIILFSSFLLLASIKNLNIDSSKVSVINGVINVIIVIIKS